MRALCVLTAVAFGGEPEPEPQPAPLKVEREPRQVDDLALARSARPLSLTCDTPSVYRGDSCTWREHPDPPTTELGCTGPAFEVRVEAGSTCCLRFPYETGLVVHAGQGRACREPTTRGTWAGTRLQAETEALARWFSIATPVCGPYLFVVEPCGADFWDGFDLSAETHQQHDAGDRALQPGAPSR